MDEFKKFLRRVDAGLSRQIRRAMAAIIADELTGLDIAPLEGRRNAFRCRVRNIRILFVRTGHGNVLIGIGFRGNVYKKRR